MTGALLADVLVPVASEDDARATAAAVLDRVAAAGGRATAVHVVEKAGGAPDKAAVEQREEYGRSTLSILEDRASALEMELSTRIVYAEDVDEAIIETAREEGASAIAFTPRPVLVFPEVERDATREGDAPATDDPETPASDDR